MRLHRLPTFPFVRALFPTPLALLGSVVLCIGPGLASGQSVTFAGGGQTTLPIIGLESPTGVAMDGAGDLFVSEDGLGVVELPKTATGFGPQITLPTSSPLRAWSVAVDGAGDVFYIEYINSGSTRLLELPKTATGYGPQTTLLAGGTASPNSLAADSAGDLFFIDSTTRQAVELPVTATGYGSVTNLPPTGITNAEAVAVDSSGDLFVVGNSGPVELPQTTTGYGSPVTLPQSNSTNGFGVIGVDSAGDVFYSSGENLMESPRTATGYGPGVSLPALLEYAEAVVGDGAGNVYIADNGQFNRVVDFQINAVNFGSESVCGAGPAAPSPCSQTLVLYFAPNAEVTLGTPQVLTGGVANLDFTAATGTYCTGEFFVGVPCQVYVTFAPTALGVRTGTVNVVNSTGTVLATATVYGTGVGVPSSPPVALVSTTSLYFGTVDYGSTATLPVIITNVGGGTLTIDPSINGGSYTISGNTCGSGLTTGNSCTLPVEFAPLDVATHNNVLTLTTNSSANPTVTLQGVAVYPPASSVTFVGAESTLPFPVLSSSIPTEIAVDSAEDVFISLGSNGSSSSVVEEWPRTATGYGSPIGLEGAQNPSYMAVDGAGDLFLAQGNLVTEYPQSGSGIQLQASVSSITALAVDTAADVFITDGTVVAEFARTATGYGPQTTLPASVSSATALAVDGTGDVFINEHLQSPQHFPYDQVEELPKTAAGYGPQIDLPVGFGGASLAADSAGNLFASDSYSSFGFLEELPSTPEGYNPYIRLQQFGQIGGLALDSAGNIFLTSYGTTSPTAMEVQTHSVDFGPVDACAAGPTAPPPCSETLTLSYMVNADATLGTPKVLTGGAPNLDFTLASGSTCTGSENVNSNGAFCTVNVTFTPEALGSRSGSVEIIDSGGNVVTTTTIAGLGITPPNTPPVATLSTTELYFDNVPFGSTESLSLTVTNIGGGTLTVSPSINGQSYTITGSTCAAGITTGNSCTLDVQFSAVIVGYHNDLLTLTTNSSTNPTVTLRGTATGVGSPTRQLIFPTIPYHTSTVIPVTITNVGVSGTVTIGTAISGISFQILTTAQNTCVAGISAGQSCVLPVEFSPTSVGDHNEILYLTPTGGAAPSNIHLDGVESAP